MRSRDRPGFRGGFAWGFLHFAHSSYAGLTRVSILLQKEMDGRVKPGHDIAGLMKIPRGRQDAHVARMADFLGRVFGMLAAVVMQRLDQRWAGRYRGSAAQRIIG